MAAPRKKIIFPTFEEILAINKEQVTRYEGFFVPPNNLKEEGALKWVLDAIQYPLFGIDNYPTLIKKATILTWTITAGHVFHDGIKRTGMSTGLSFLLLNGKVISVSPEEIEDVALLVADSTNKGFTEIDLEQWLHKITRRHPY